ncbi:hypothetical protein [Paramicrobacterium agarici]|uniref:hypothetical protein n=1 Tax=Paramicrobacterium agarici TaxID=630514 RepID=UPI001151F3D5|nr:hypothetical protein [Microbacterium agarici]TQO23421.1 hypothetical protein FB385_2271 [Microbacterium agarici]
MDEHLPGPADSATSGTRRRSIADLVATIVLTALSIVIALGAMYWGALSVMLTDPCTPATCDFSAIDIGTGLAVGGVWIPPVLGVLVAVPLLVTRRIAWWVPTVAIAATIALEIVGATVISGAVS